MSGSSIGGLAGGVIGFAIGGPAGAQWGFMIGSAVGGYVDPQRIEGPRITDAQAQTSMEGAPRTIVYGTCCVAGNLIQWGPLVEHKRTERQGKGGPKVTTYTYTRTIAIRICEAAPLGGAMKLRRVWMDDKLVYDVSEGSVMTAESQAFASILTFYDGSEDQLPDPSLEALDEEYGGGVGNVPAYRGTCYAVLTDLDCTDRQGSVPQFRWEVCSDATEEPLPGPTVGLATATAVIGDADTDTVYMGYGGEVITFMAAEGLTPIGSPITYGIYNSELTEVSSGTYNNSADVAIYPRAGYNGWLVAASGSDGKCRLLYNGEYMAFLVPYVGAADGWWYSEEWYHPEYGGLIWFTASSVYVAARETGNSGTAYNTVYRFPLEDAGEGRVYADAASPKVTNGARYFIHMDRAGTIRTISQDEKKLVTYDADLGVVSTVDLPMSLSSLDAFGVDSGVLALYTGGVADRISFYDLATLAFAQSVDMGGTVAGVNSQVIFTDDSVYVRSGVNLKRVGYAPSCYTAAPDGWYDLPDTPNAFTNGTDIMPRCGAVDTVTPGKVSLPAIVADLGGRAGVDSDQFDLSALNGIEVRGYPVARQTTADAAIRELQQVFFFDLPEWGNSGDTGTKLRAVLRGGASVYTLTEDDLVDNDDDEDTRPQQVEYPRKVWATASDPEANYEAVSEPAERETENVKAVGEVRMATSVVLVRDEIKQLAEKSMKTRWAATEGRTTQEVVDALSQYTPSDVITFNDKRYRIDRTERRDGSVVWEMERDRASAATSTATGSGALSPTTPTGTVRGPTIFQALNLPSLRSADNVPGVYIAAQGLLPGWIGADIYLSVDGGVTEQKIATITDPATMGVLAEATDADGNDTSGLISVTLYKGGELDSITEAQMDARLNGFALTTAGVSEVGQFQYAEETSTPLLYDLSNVLRGQLGTTAAAHSAGDSFVLLDGAVLFVPIDAIHSGETLIFRAVSIGTAPANNPTTSIVFDPPVFFNFGGTVTP